MKIKDYELLERIGKGGFGEVYRAQQISLGRDVAVKILLEEFSQQPDWIKRFHTEATIIGKLEHPFIVPLYDYWQDDNGVYLVMRWMRGGSLREQLNKRPPEMPEIRRWVEQIARALHAAHSAGVIHRDLKPENILLDEEGNAYLADFGIAKNLTLTQPTHSQQPLTPSYAAPEQFSGDPVTPRY